MLTPKKIRPGSKTTHKAFIYCNLQKVDTVFNLILLTVIQIRQFISYFNEITCNFLNLRVHAHVNIIVFLKPCGFRAIKSGNIILMKHLSFFSHNYRCTYYTDKEYSVYPKGCTPVLTSYVSIASFIYVVHQDQDKIFKHADSRF